MTYRYAVLRLPGLGARIVDLGTGLEENEAWTAARRACTPSERVDALRETRAGAEHVILGD